MPAAMAITFLSAPADLDADDVVARVGAECPRRERALHAPRPTAMSADATTTAVGWPRATSSANDGPESTASELRPGSSSRGHLAHPQQRGQLEALGGRQHVGVGAQMRGQLPVDAAAVLGRHRDRSELRAVRRGSQVGCDPYLGRQRDARKIRVAASRPRHLLRVVAAAHPQRNRVARCVQLDRQCAAPRAAAEDSCLHEPPLPSRCSSPRAMRARLPLCFQMMSAASAAAVKLSAPRAAQEEHRRGQHQAAGDRAERHHARHRERRREDRERRRHRPRRYRAGTRRRRSRHPCRPSLRATAGTCGRAPRARRRTPAMAIPRSAPRVRPPRRPCPRRGGRPRGPAPCPRCARRWWRRRCRCPPCARRQHRTGARPGS